MIYLNLNVVSTLILSIFLYILCSFIKKHTKVFNTLCIPTPVIAGLLFSIFVFLLKKFNLGEVTMDTSLMPYFLSIFFISIGLCIDISSVKRGGKLLFIYWVLCAILGLLQNIVAVVESKFLNIEPLLGFMCGSVSMEGGHGYALAFGQTIENIGIKNAVTIGIAAATFGLILGGLLGGPCGKFLIKRYNLKPIASKKSRSDNFELNKQISKKMDLLNFFENLLVLLIIMNISFYIANFINIKINILIPNIVIGMLFSVIITNLNFKVKILDLNFDFLNFVQDVTLGIFLTMALMSIDIYALSNLFGCILFIVISQVLLVISYGFFICFKVLGKDYDAAVMISGLIGHTLGATPNALANMDTICKKYKKSENAFLVVPIVGAFLLDAFSIPCILFFINFLK